MSQIQNMNSLQSINNDDFYKHILSKIMKPRKKKNIQKCNQTNMTRAVMKSC